MPVIKAIERRHAAYWTIGRCLARGFLVGFCGILSPTENTVHTGTNWS